MAKFSIAFPIAKIDEEKRQVWGWATVEQPDKQGDIVDYNASVEAFSAWPGNIREQHDRHKAVGRAIQVRPDPERKAILVGAFISRGAEDTWQKVKDGTLRGFSIGGEALETRPEIVKDGGTERTYNRITKYRLDELSLVDNPACPDARILMVKAVDGELVATDALGKAGDAAPKASPAPKGQVLTDGDAPSLDRGAEPFPSATEGGKVLTDGTAPTPEPEDDDDGDPQGNQDQRGRAPMAGRAQVQTSVDPGPQAKAAGQAITIQVPDGADVQAIAKAIADQLAKVAKRDFDPNVGGGVDRDRIPDEDFAGPDRSFPIVTPADVSDAVHSLGRTKHDRDAIKRRIIEIARRKGPEFEAELPESWKGGGDDDAKADAAEKTARPLRRFVRKCIDAVADAGPGYDDIVETTMVLQNLSRVLQNESQEFGGDEADRQQLAALQEAVDQVLNFLRSEFTEYYGSGGEPGDKADGKYAAAGGSLRRRREGDDEMTREEFERSVAAVIGREIAKAGGGMEKVAAVVEQLAGDLAKVAETLSRLEGRVEHLEQQPMPGVQEPALRAVSISKSLGDYGSQAGEPDFDRQALERIFEKTTNPRLKQEIGHELAKDELLRLYRAEGTGVRQ
jgi:hypothetical protein